MSDNQVSNEVILHSWTYHPGGDQPVKATSIVFLILLISWLSSWFIGNFGFGILVFLFLIFAVGNYIFATQYTLTESGVSWKLLCFKVQRSWTEFKGYATDEDAVLLSPFRRRTFTEKTRGIILRGVEKEKVLNIIKAHNIEPLPRLEKK